MFGSRRNKELSFTPKPPYSDFESSKRSEFKLYVKEREVKPGQMIIFEVNATNGNAVRLNLFCQLMQTKLYFRRGRLQVDEEEIGNALSKNTFCNFLWHDHIIVPNQIPVTMPIDPNYRNDLTNRLVEISYRLRLSTRVESRMLRDAVDITIIPWEDSERVPGPLCARHSQFLMGNSAPGGTGPGWAGQDMTRAGLGGLVQSYNQGFDASSRRELANRSPPPRYSMLSIHSAFAGSTETLPPAYEEAIKK